MPRIHSLHLFLPHIAERGLLYFQQGKVRDIQKTSTGRYRAAVCGSENYSVWLKLDSDLYMKDGGCDCPYGGACKHMAVLWYAVRAQTPDGQPDEPDAQQPKKGGNPYRQQLSRIFSRARPRSCRFGYQAARLVGRCGARGNGGVGAGFASVDTAFAGCF